jgi:hypothetical protein
VILVEGLSICRCELIADELNKKLRSWEEILGDTTVAAALLDRLLHRSVVFTLDGDSYRLRDHYARSDTTSEPPPPAPGQPLR